MRSPTFQGALVALAFAAPLELRAQTTPGYVLNPTGVDTTRVFDEEGMTHFRETRRRTPTGFLYPYPLEPERLSELGGGWLGRGSIEVGGIFTTGDTDETRFERYTDWSENFLLNSLSLAFLHRESGFYGEVYAGGIGRNDAYYYGEIGRLGLLRLRGAFSGIPRAYAKDARNLYAGAGSEVLTLPPSLKAGDNSDQDVADALGAIGESTLSVQRDDLGLSLDVWPLPSMKLFARYALTEREGERPFGGSLLYKGAASSLARAVETTQPLDDRTHEVSLGIEAGRDWLLGNLAYNGSFYRNANDRLTWDNPFRVVDPLAGGAEYVKRGRFALAPDNDWHNARGDLALRIARQGRLSATASWSRMRQDDDLLYPTRNSGLVGLSLIDLDRWNNARALARESADATVDTLLVNADLRLRPWKPIRLGARIRYYDRDNRTDYTAFNPDTGQFGYIAEDGALAVGTPFNRVFEPGRPSDDWRYRSTPFSYDQLLVEATADTQLRAKTGLGLHYSWEQIDRDHRERDRTWENRIRADLKSRDVSWATLRLSYEYGDRGGTSYDPNPYREFYVSSLTPDFEPFPVLEAPFTLAQLRKYDLSDRQQHLANLRVNFLVREDMDVALAAAYRDDDYDADYGLEVERSGSVNLEWSFQPSPNLNGYLFGTYEEGESAMSTINDALSPADPDPNAGGSDFPFENAWSLDTRSRSGAVGAGIWLRVLGHLIFESSYQFIFTEQELDYDFASDGSLDPDDSGAGAGSRFPDLRTRDHILQSSLRLELTDELAVRVFHYYQRGEIEDFQQDGLEAGVIAGSLFLGHVDRDYAAHVIGATVQLRFPPDG